MLDVLYIVITVIFFAFSAAFTRGCYKLFRKDQND